MDDAMIFVGLAAERAGIAVGDISDAALGEFPVPEGSPLAQGLSPHRTQDDTYDSVRGCVGSIMDASQRHPESFNAVLEDCEEAVMKQFVIAAIELLLESPAHYGIRPDGSAALTELLAAVRATTPL